jgi:hypothetical protein
MQEMTLYPTNKEQGSLYRDVLEKPIKKQFPEYYFDKLEKSSGSSRKKYSGLPLSIQNSLRELERAGKR